MSIVFRSPAVALVLTCSLVAVPRAQAPEQGPKPVARSGKAMASASHPIVTRAMLDVMRGGGNAVDAAITAVILQPILEPQMSTLAGGMSMLVYEAKTGTLHYLDAELDHTSKDAPLGTIMGGGGIAETSGRRIGVPGTVAGLRAAAEKFGTKKWSEYFEPAIRTAEQGFPMYSFLYGEMADAAMGRISAQSSGREEFLPDGFVPPVGTTVTRPRLATTLRRLAADGTPYFYTGEWAQHFVDAVVKTGGSISLEDMASYEARWEEPLRSTYRGYEIASSPPPATAGTLIAMILNILEPYDLTKMPHFAESSRTLALVRHAFGLAGFNSEAFVRDPLSGDVPMTTLLSKEYAKMLSALIDKSWPSPEATPSAADAAPAPPMVAASGHAANDPSYSDTNHFVVVDGQGNWVTLTHTVYGSTFATGLVVDGVGVNSGNGFPGAAGRQGTARRLAIPADHGPQGRQAAHCPGFAGPVVAGGRAGARQHAGLRDGPAARD